MLWPSNQVDKYKNLVVMERMIDISFRKET